MNWLTNTLGLTPTDAAMVTAAVGVLLVGVAGSIKLVFEALAQAAVRKLTGEQTKAVQREFVDATADRAIAKARVDSATEAGIPALAANYLAAHAGDTLAKLRGEKTVEPSSLVPGIEARIAQKDVAKVEAAVVAETLAGTQKEPKQ
jgi:hypothetical protein